MLLLFSIFLHFIPLFSIFPIFLVLVFVESLVVAKIKENTYSESRGYIMYVRTGNGKILAST